MRLSPESTVFVLVDVQGKLAQLMHGKETLFENLRKAVAGILALEIPILWLEQNPSKMGETIPELRELLEGHAPIPKMSFSACGEPVFMEKLAETGRECVLLAGIETHVCMIQTVTDLVEQGYRVQVMADAVSSRSRENRQIGLERIRTAGAELTSVEMALFELMRTAEHPRFRDLLKIVR